MKGLVKIHFTARARRELDECMEFVARQPWGNPDGRRRDLLKATEQVRKDPLRNPVRKRLERSGLELRRHTAAQFMIIYAYLPPSDAHPHGLVSI